MKKSLQLNIELDRKGFTSYYTNIKNLLTVIDKQKDIYQVQNKSIKKSANNVRNAYNTIFAKHFFDRITKTNSNGSLGKFEIYSKIKKNYTQEDYIFYLSNHKLRQNITKLRTSSHCLPIETLRKAKVPREQRLCNMCNEYVGSEYHVIIECDNSFVCQIRQKFLLKIYSINKQLENLSKADLFTYLLLGVDKCITFYFAVFLDKIFKKVKNQV